MANIMRDFVSEEQRPFRFKIGRSVASALAGFIAGVICATLIWGIAIYFLKLQAKYSLLHMMFLS